MSIQIKTVKTTRPLPKPDQSDLGFGRYHTDHMFIMDYTSGIGWHDARIVPYAELELDPSSMVLHYGQAVFEGLKAYKSRDGRVLLFRADKNAERLNISNDSVCIPPIDTEITVEAIRKLVDFDREWIPAAEGTSLYIRPFVIATDPYLGVKASATYKFIIIMSPVGSYYAEGLNPVKIYVETKYARSVKGGLGYAKVPGNYAASLKAQVEAKKKGYSQVLWLDGIGHKYIEEVGTSNVFFIVGDEVLTPSADGTILAGITRATSIELLKSWGMKVIERKILFSEIADAMNAGNLKEAFATGTAAVISPIGELYFDGRVMTVNDSKIGPVAQKLYDTITGIQSGKIADIFNWTTEV